MLQDFRQYRDAAIDIFAIPIPARKSRRLWFNERWIALASTAGRNVTRGPDQIDRIMSGRQNANAAHVELMHRILGLSDYGLSVEEAWPTIGDGEAERLKLKLEKFEELLRSYRTEHADPLHLLRLHANDGLAFHVEQYAPRAELGGAAQQKPMITSQDTRPLVEKAEDADAVEAHTYPQGTPLRFALVPRADGHVLLLSHEKQHDGVVVLRAFGLASEVEHRAGRIVASEYARADAEPGRRDIYVVNWPTGVAARGSAATDLKHLGLAPLFLDRQESVIEKTELRRIGACAAETADLPDDRRVHVAMLCIELTKPA